MNQRKRYKIPVAKLGEYPHGDNLIQVLDSEALDSIVRNTNASLGKTGRIQVDFDHASEYSSEIVSKLAEMGVQFPTNAGAWISEGLYREGDTVYANAVATPDGEIAIDGETYTRTSPVFRMIDCSYLGSRGGKKLLRPLKIKSIGLTNSPNMKTLGAIIANSNGILTNAEDDLQSVMLGSLSMDILKKEKETMSETKDETVVEEVVVNAVAPEAPAAVEEEPTVEEIKEAVKENVSGEVGIIAESQGLDPEKAEVVAEVAVSAVADGLEAVEQATIEATPVASTIASGTELEKAQEKIAELEAKIKELTDARDAEALQNRINEELAKYPTLQNRAESEALLKLDWDLGVKFLASLPKSLPPASKTIQNRVPTKAPGQDFGKMTLNERLKAKMFGK